MIPGFGGDSFRLTGAREEEGRLAVGAASHLRMELIVNDGPKTAPADFLIRLAAFDPTLYVEYNPRRHRWVIEQCTEHFAPGIEHTHVCRRIYVWLVQDPESNYLSLDHAERIFEELARRDTRRAGYAPGPEGLKKFITDADYELERDRQKRESEMAKQPRLARKDNWLSMNRVKRLLERHSLRVNK